MSILISMPEHVYTILMDDTQKKYEVVYLLSPSLTDEEALTQAGTITSLLEDAGGITRRVEEPKKRKLAYAIKKNSYAYFGWTTFAMLPEQVILFNKKLLHQPHILRYLVVEEEVEARPPILRTLMHPTLSNVQKSRASIPQEVQKNTEERLDLEALDKKLEEILGK